MSGVKTYAVNVNDSWLNTDGDDISESYVKYADYKAIATRLDIAERACAALSAENAGLKSKGREVLNEACKVYDKFNANVDSDCGGFMDWQTLHEFQLLLDVEATATDAVLAEIERKAIRKFINSIEHILRDKLSPYDTEEMLEAMRIFSERTRSQAMKRASPVELRQSLEMANALASAGIRFVPVPVINDAGFNRLVDESRKIIDGMLIESEHDTTNQQFESLSNHKHNFINGTCVECLKSE